MMLLLNTLVIFCATIATYSCGNIVRSIRITYTLTNMIRTPRLLRMRKISQNIKNCFSSSNTLTLSGY